MNESAMTPPLQRRDNCVTSANASPDALSLLAPNTQRVAVDESSQKPSLAIDRTHQIAELLQEVTDLRKKVFGSSDHHL